MGNYVLLNLFLAVLLDGFSVNSDEEEAMEYNDLYLKKTQLPLLEEFREVFFKKRSLM